MARAQQVKQTDGTIGNIARRIAPTDLKAMERHLEITEAAKRKDYLDRLDHLLVFYNAEVQQQPEIHCRDEIRLIAYYAEQLSSALQNASDTARDRINRSMRAGGESMTVASLLDVINRASIDIAPIDDKGRDMRAETKSKRTYEKVIDRGASREDAQNAADKILQDHYQKHPKPGHYSRASLLVWLGVELMRLHCRHHPSGTFSPGTRKDGLKGLQYETDAAKWFDMVIRAIIPDIKASEVNTTLKDALTEFNQPGQPATAPQK